MMDMGEPENETDHPSYTALISCHPNYGWVFG
jgi:hypothetical protein